MQNVNGKIKVLKNKIVIKKYFSTRINQQKQCLCEKTCINQTNI